MTFVSGHPGHTDRQDTVAHLKFLRDDSIPFILEILRRREVLLSVYSQRSQENARRAKEALLGIQNSRKADVGRLGGLQDPELMEKKRADEAAFRRAVEADPRLARDCGGAWDDVAAAMKAWRRVYLDEELIEQGMAFDSRLFGVARAILRLAEEKQKPNASRLREYRESNLASLEQAVFSPAPIYDDLESLTLADSLAMFMEMKGGDDKLVRRAMAGKSPTDRAAELVAGTRLRDVAVRKRLAEGGLAAVEASHDPMIELARLVDPTARKLRRCVEQNVQESLQQAYGRLARARFALEGTSVYPDATFTLRLAFGVVAGYTHAGERLPAVDDPRRRLPPRRRARRPRALRPAADLAREQRPARPEHALQRGFHGGHYRRELGQPGGQPPRRVGGLDFRRQSAFVGVGLCLYGQGRPGNCGRCRAIQETLRNIYDAGDLADELGH